MSQHALPGTDELGATCLLGGQADDDRGGVGERDARADSRPAGHWWALQAEAAEQAEDAAEEALNAGTFAEFRGGLGGWQTGAVLLAFGVPGDDGDRAQYGVDPVNQVQSPVARIQADDARAHSIEPDRPGEQGLGEGGVVAVGWRQEEEEGKPEPRHSSVWTR
jgi:hypothetical protein